jgi:predicted nuclease with TOPRIM domain
MIALVLILLCSCCVGESSAFLCRPGMSTLQTLQTRPSQNVQRFRVIALEAKRDNSIADLKIQMAILETEKNLAVEKSLERIEYSIKEELGRQMNTRFDKLETKFDQLETRFDKLETKFDQLETNIITEIDKLKKMVEEKFQKSDTRFVDKLDTAIESIPLLVTPTLVGSCLFSEVMVKCMELLQ